MSLIRYPGGKNKIKNKILDSIINLESFHSMEYREPFFGGGSIGLALIEHGIKNIWINDRDPAMACLWTSVLIEPNSLIKKIQSYKPTVESFFSIREELLAIDEIPKETSNIIDIGFKKFVIHQISFSGLGTKSGGPLGGIEQKSEYKVDCRWSPIHFCKKIEKFHSLFKKVKVTHDCCTNFDFEILLKNKSKNYYSYIDPPYFHKGNDLYQFGFSSYDHLRLSKCLKSSNAKWILSYDDCKEIRSLYEWACVQEIDVNYTIASQKDNVTGKKSFSKKGELIIRRCV